MYIRYFVKWKYKIYVTALKNEMLVTATLINYMSSLQSFELQHNYGVYKRTTTC